MRKKAILSSLASCSAVACILLASDSELVKDRTKRRIEGPTELVLTDENNSRPSQRFDGSKIDVEENVESLIELKSGGSTNPQVEPGKVSWYTDLNTACEAAKSSGKPVLLFQMMGRLDQQFC